MDYYAILGIEKNATEKEIADAYRKLARQHHPDVNPSGTEDFKKITKAFEVLNNPQKRAEYDRFGIGGGGFNGNPFGNNNPFSGFGFPNAENLFRDIFTQRPAPQPQQERRTDEHVEMHISFNDAVYGCKKTIPLIKKKPCDQCNKGTINWETCTLCNGSGQRTIHQRPFIIQTPCNSCQATGKICVVKCKNCNGTGHLDDTITEIVEFEIPAGVDEGMQVRLADKGTTGDLYIKLCISPHLLFKRQGDDLNCVYLLPYTQLILGTIINLSLQGKNIEIIVPPNTQSGTKIRVPGQGVKNLNSQQVGNMIVEVQSDVSDNLSQDLINLLGEQERQSPSSNMKKFEEILLKL